MASKELKATAKLFLDTSSAKQDAAQFVGDLKKKLRDIETAADKMSVFKDLVGYIGQVDAALTALRVKNQDAFDHMFDGLDDSLRKALEDIFGMSGEQIGQFKMLREQLDSFTTKSSIKDVREFAKSINSLYESVGKTPPLNIDEFSRSVKPKNIEDIKNAVDGLSVSLGEANSRLKKGFGVGGGSGSGGGLGGEADKIKKQIEDIKTQISEYKRVREELQKITQEKESWKETKFLNDDFTVEYTADTVKELVTAYNEARAAKENFEKSGDTSSVEYYENLAKLAKAALQIEDVYENGIDGDDNFMKELKSIKYKRGNLLSSIDNIKFSDEYETLFENILGGLDTAISQTENSLSGLEDKLSNLGSAGSGTGGSADEAIDDIGAAAESAKKKVDNLKQALTDLLTKGSQMQVDVAQGKSDGKESMTLFGDDGVISTASGQDYSVDTDALVGQLITNLKKDIVMSLHNHPDGMSFSPSDLQSFADLYYGQGTKMHGIIADGFIKTIDFTGISQETAQKIASTYAQNLSELSSKYTEYFTIEDGNIKLSDKLSKYRTEQPDKYNKIMDTINDLVDASINDAFTSNGLESTLQGFSESDLPNLAQQLADMQISGQNAIAPIEKLKNLLSTMHPDKAFDWNKYNEIFEQFEDGAIDGTQAINQILDLKTVDAQTEQTKDKISNQNSQLSEQLALIKQISQAYDDLADAQSVGTESQEEKAKEKIEALEEQYYGLIATMKDGSKVKIPLDDEFSEMSENMLQNVSQIQNIEFVPRDAENAINAYERIDKVLANISTRWKDPETLERAIGSFSNRDIEDTQRYLKQATEAIELGDADFKFGSQDKYNQAIKALEKLDTLSKRVDLSQAFGGFTDGLDVEWTEDLTEAYQTVFKGIKDGTHTTLDDCIAKFKELTRTIEESTKTDPVEATEQSEILAQASAEIAQLDALKAKLSEVTAAVEAKTAAFEAGYVTADAAIEAEIDSLNRLKSSLEEVQNLLQFVLPTGKNIFGDFDVQQDKASANSAQNIIASMQATLGQILGVLQGFTGIDSDGKNSVKKKEPVVDNRAMASEAYDLLAQKLPDNIATEGTLQGVKGAVENLASIMKAQNDSNSSQIDGTHQALNTLISALGANIKSLRDVMDGVIPHQKAQKSDTAKAMARIQDPAQFKQISSIAGNSVGDLGTDVHIKSLKALTNGLVSVEGAFKNVNGEWEGFTVKVNESNNAVDLAINKQSSFAKVMRKLDDEMERIAKASEDDNKQKLSPDATKSLATIKAEGYDDDGKEITVQYKDSQRYTVSLKENIGGLQKEVFQTFDDSIENFNERTTVTVSNKAAAAIRDTNKLIKQNTKDVNNANLLREYNAEYDKLINMNDQYRSMSNLGDNDIDTWNNQITLVQNLGNQITGLIKQQQKLEGEKGVATSAKRLQEYQSSADEIFRGLDFGLNTADQNNPAQQKIVGIYDQIIEKVDLLKKSHSVLTDQQTQEVNTLVASLKKEAEAYQGAIDSVFKSDRDKKLSKFDLDKTMLEQDIDTSSFSQQINDARIAIANAANTDSLKIAMNGWDELQNKIKAAAIQQDLFYKKEKETKEKPDQFTKDFDKQKTNFAQYKQDVQSAAGVTDELRAKLGNLETELGTIGDTDGLNKWQQSLKQLKTEIDIAQKSFKSAKIAMSSEIAGKANSKFKELDFKTTDNNLTQEQTAIVNVRKQLLQQIRDYNIQVSSGQNAEISGIERTKESLYQLIDAYKKAHNIENARGSSTAKTYGMNQLQTFTARYNSLISGAADVGLDEQSSSVSNLINAYRQLQAAQNAFAVGEDLTSAAGQKKVAAFKAAQQACNSYARDLNKVVTASKKLATDSIISDSLAEDFEDSFDGRKTALMDFVNSMYGANVSVGEFDDAFNRLSFSVKNGDGTFTKMTASINEARTAIHATAGATGEVTGRFEAFFGELKGKFKSIGSYFAASMGWEEILQQVRQGFQYVRDIDAALTELKKVTNETDATYNNFLQSMSKTAGVVGSTVADLTNMAADWSRLGYSLEDSAKLAESTAILLNVSEFQDATAASEALISTMQAFGYVADDSQHVVDILNEVGKLLPVDNYIG